MRQDLLIINFKLFISNYFKKQKNKESSLTAIQNNSIFPSRWFDGICAGF